jgi:hypothetical protein
LFWRSKQSCHLSLLERCRTQQRQSWHQTLIHVQIGVSLPQEVNIEAVAAHQSPRRESLLRIVIKTVGLLGSDAVQVTGMGEAKEDKTLAMACDNWM